MGKKNKSRKARRTGTPVGEEEVPSDYEVVEEIYEVECVVDHRNRRGGTEYKVRWRGWSPQFDEWLHYSKMDCPEAIREYWERVEKAKESQSSAKKRDHSDAHSARSSSSKKRTSSPEAKRRQTSSPDPKRQRNSSPDDKKRRTSSPDPKRRLDEGNDPEVIEVKRSRLNVSWIIEIAVEGQNTKFGGEDCPEAIREYWERVEKAKESQSSAKKRDHSDAHSARSSSSKKRTSSPEAKRRQTSSPDPKRQRNSSPDDKKRRTSSPDPKRRLDEGNDPEVHAHVESGSVSPTISECMGGASPKECVTEETSQGVVPSAGKKKATNKRSNVEPMKRLSADRPEEVKVASQPPVDVPSSSSHEQMQASNVLERSSQTAADIPSSSSQPQASDASARSSPFPPPQAPARKSIPPPPAIPKRKRVQSMSSAASSPSNIAESSGI
ncbi:hypothetical protein GCK32_012708, partial [Trichostrongylus colubriformis]